ncbi:MAG: 23S rRNA (guanosine(2251)-2'-O)-methyltransferase RlmB [Alphaproteobacteria bacterium]
MNFKKKNNSAPLLYGFHAVREAWLNPDRTIQNLYLTEQSAKGFDPTLAEAKNKGLRRPQPQIVDKKKLDKLLPQGAVHQGIALAASDVEERDVQDFIIRAKTADKSVILMLDQVTDPHNVGAILRSACAFGAAGIVMQKKHAPSLDGVLAKTACGAVEHVPVAYETNLSRALEAMKEEGFFVFGLDERGVRSVDQIRDDNHSKIVLVLGAEGPGIRHLIKENCDELVKLPTSGAIQSLNVSNAAAVALFCCQ